MAKVPEYLMPENFFPPRLARGDDERDVNKAWFEQFTRYVMAAHGVTREHVQLQILGLYVLFSLKWLICLPFRFLSRQIKGAFNGR
jgi:hypothetical protein